VGRSVVRPGQRDERVAGRAVGRTDGPQGMSGVQSRGAVGVVRRAAVRAGPVARVRGPVAGGRVQVRAGVHRRDLGHRVARPSERGRRGVRLGRRAGGHGRGAARPVPRDERVPRRGLPRARDARVPAGQRPDGRGAARVPLVPARRRAGPGDKAFAELDEAVRRDMVPLVSVVSSLGSFVTNKLYPPVADTAGVRVMFLVFCAINVAWAVCAACAYQFETKGTGLAAIQDALDDFNPSSRSDGRPPEGRRHDSPV